MAEPADAEPTDGKRTDLKQTDLKQTDSQPTDAKGSPDAKADRRAPEYRRRHVAQAANNSLDE